MGLVILIVVLGVVVINVGFVFVDYDYVWKGVDGVIGDYVCG